MNIVVIKGNIGSDAKERVTPNGKKFVSFSVATNYRGEGEDARTDWHNVVVWGFHAERAKQLKKGDNVIVVGEARTRRWQDQNTNNTMERTEIHVFGENCCVGVNVISKRLNLGGEAATSSERNIEEIKKKNLPGYSEFKEMLDDEVPF